MKNNKLFHAPLHEAIQSPLNMRCLEHLNGEQRKQLIYASLRDYEKQIQRLFGNTKDRI